MPPTSTDLDKQKKELYDTKKLRLAELKANPPPVANYEERIIWLEDQIKLENDLA